MSEAFIIAVPAKGRLQENAESFFARAGLTLLKPRGARDYRGSIADVPAIAVAYLSAAEIVEALAEGGAHFGVTGRDLVHELISDPDQRSIFIDDLGFGHANVVVAVPQAWIDVRSMADLDDVASAFRLKHERKMRVATKYVNLTRGFFAARGITDYRIVESSGATEGAPAAGTAELIVDITTDRLHPCRKWTESDRGWHHPALASEPRRVAASEMGCAGTRYGSHRPRSDRSAKARARSAGGAHPVCRM